MKKLITKDSIDWLSNSKIYFHWDPCAFDVSIGDYIDFRDGLTLEPYVGFYGVSHAKNICNMGSFSYSVSPIADPNFSVGRYCSIAEGLRFQGDRHPYEYMTTSNVLYEKYQPVIHNFIRDNQPNYSRIFDKTQKGSPVLEHDVWIGQDVLLNSGVRVGTGAVVASQSVVTRDVEPYTIVGGNPAKVIKKRFDDETIALLLESEWWNYKFIDFTHLPVKKPMEFALRFLELKAQLSVYAPPRICMDEIP